MAANVDRTQDRLRGDVDHVELAGNVHEIGGSVHANQSIGSEHGHRGRFTGEVQRADRQRRFGIADVDEADALARAVGIDQRAAVDAGSHDFGGSAVVAVAARIVLQADRQHGDAVEIHVGAGDADVGRVHDFGVVELAIVVAVQSGIDARAAARAIGIAGGQCDLADQTIQTVVATGAGCSRSTGRPVRTIGTGCAIGAV